jgi:hypothetical protein
MNFEYLGPVSAANIDIAMALSRTALAALSGKTVAIDVPDSQLDWIAWLTRLGFEKQRPFVRMYCGRNIPGDPKRQFSIMGPEFG